ncbi:hypothetical protein D3C81_1319020 [compost metagenome]
MLDGRHAGIGPLVLWVALLAVERRGTTAKRRVLTVAGMAVEVVDRGAQPGRVDTAGLGQLFERGTLLEVATAHVRPHRQRRRTGMAQAIAAQEAMVADQPRAHLFILRHRRDHGRHIVVVAMRFVDETLAVGQYTDNARFAAFDDVREVPDAAIAVRHLRNRRPGHRRLQVGGDHAAGRLAQAQAIARTALWGQGQVVVAAGIAWEQLPAPGVVVGETTRREHHGFGADQLLALRRGH